MLALRPGDVVQSRFAIEREAGSGGMGTVYRARDNATGGPVGLKVLRGTDAVNVARFEREATVLAGLEHPGVVRFVAHGTTADDHQFLAMEWLEGEDLAARLARTGLTVEESL